MENLEKVRSLYETIKDRFYFGDELLICQERYEPVALFGLITLILNGKELIFGGYGSGKTTSSERLSSLVKGLPLEFVQATTISGHPEQTEEKIKATLDLAALQKEGREVVRWRVVPFAPVVIIDEINRLPVGKQSMLLNEVERNIWNWRGETIIFKEKKAFFATINYQDLGTTRLIPPLLDRFDLAVETARLHPIRKRFVRRGIDDKVLSHRELSKKMLDFVLNHNKTEEAEKVVKYIEKVSEEFKKELEKRLKEEGISVKIPTREEMEEIREEIEHISVSDDVELFLDYLGQEVYCQKGLQKDFSRCGGCHYKNYICADIYSISHRAEQSLFRYAKAMAWINGEKEVTLEHLQAVFPYVLWHRASISDERIAKVRETEKETGDAFYALNEIIKDVKKRWEEHRDYQIEAYLALKSGDTKTVIDLAERIDHPFFKALKQGV
ncbi:MAG TPA: hypothetical protein ENG63_02985 [Candidatus Desulfofervidus auxilii]|uniref:ATPase dynein-related AAA domain-containing protein n=1 Tax=Desulfofervidus auxilii TaxID=1621989 RepID=A0A7C0Y9E6_DESA2|nr:hypothetical protein [Candidatus Desulfofervidus auxilii]